MKPDKCGEYSVHCAMKGLTCEMLNNLDGNLMGAYCVKRSCTKDKDCSTLDDKKLKHKPGKCEDKKCIYDFFDYSKNPKPSIVSS